MVRPQVAIRTIAAIAMLLVGASSAAAQQKAATVPAPVGDDRETITLTPSERNELLKGMRRYLESLQGITEALAKNDDQGVAVNARNAGAKMLLDVPAMVPVKMPVQFSALSLATHEKFDVLAARAEKAASRGEVLSALAEIMTNCTGCHSAYRVEPAP